MVRLNDIRAERVRAGLTQRQIADALHCSENAYRAKEKGRAPFDVLEADLFCKACGITDPARKCHIFLA